MFGHFTPLVPLVAELQGRGHQVLVATEPAFGDEVRRRGFNHIGVGRDVTLDDVFSVLPEIFEVPPEDQDAYARPRVFVELRASNVVGDLLDVAAEWRPDLILRESGELASWAVAERLEVPHVTVNAGAGTSDRQWETMAASWLRDLGARVGLDDLDAGSLYRYLLISFEPAGYYDWADIPTAAVFRPPVVSSDHDLGQAFAALDQRPLVYVTLGTEFYNRELMATILAALVDRDWNVAASTGPRGDPAAVDPHLAHVIVAQWLPQDTVLGRAALVVTHAGAGTTIGSLIRGVPLVCLPQGADQFHHARRVEELGVGVSLTPSEQSPEAITAAANEVIQDVRFRDRGAEVRAETARLPGVETAATLLERTSTERA
jgi:UDP:flavonoid glycosyltransferase YjiC (YdhE family)